MVVPTRSNRRRNGRAWAAVLLGLLSCATLPAAVAVTRYTRFTLLEAGWAIPLAFVLGVLALQAGRAARRRTERTIGRIGGARTTRIGRILGGLGVYTAVTAALAVGAFELLNYLSG